MKEGQLTGYFSFSASKEGVIYGMYHLEKYFTILDSISDFLWLNVCNNENNVKYKFSPLKGVSKKHTFNSDMFVCNSLRLKHLLFRSKYLLANQRSTRFHHKSTLAIFEFNKSILDVFTLSLKSGNFNDYLSLFDSGEYERDKELFKSKSVICSKSNMVNNNMNLSTYIATPSNNDGEV